MAFQFLRSTSDIDLYEQYWIAKARENFWAYRRYMNPDMLVGWWQREIARELMGFYDRFIAGERPILLIQAPPQHGKSTQVVDFLAWMAGQDPAIKTIYTGFSERLGVRANLALQRAYDGPKYPRMFPDTRIAERNSVTISGQTLRNREILEYVDYEGYFRNTTVRGSVTGEGLDLGVIDDPIKGREEANSATVREKTWDWLTDDFMSRFSDRGALLGIMTRWHIDDPFGRMIERLGDRVKVLRYPAIAEENEPNRKEGEPLFPEHKSLSFLQERKEAMYAGNWEALYQQNPIIIGGGLFHDDWWQYVDTPPLLDHRIIYADTANKTKQEHDYSVFQCWGKTLRGPIVLLDMIRGKWEAPELLEQGRAFWAKHAATKDAGRLRAMKVEDKVSGSGLIQTLKREGIPIIPIQRGVDKISRGHDAAPSVESGNVLLLRGCPHLSDFIGEVSAFPNGKHDDMVDPMMDAVADMLLDSQGKKAGTLW